MPKVVLTLEEVGVAFTSLRTFDVGGDRCVDGVELLRAVQQLVGVDGTPQRRADGWQDRPAGWLEAEEAQRARDREGGLPFRGDPNRPAETPGVSAQQGPPPAALDPDPLGCVRVEEAQLVLQRAGYEVDAMEYATARIAAGAEPPRWYSDPRGPGIQSMVSIAAEAGDFVDGRLMHAGGPAQFAPRENLNPNPPEFALPHLPEPPAT